MIVMPFSSLPYSEDESTVILRKLGITRSKTQREILEGLDLRCVFTITFMFPDSMVLWYNFY
jgi:hypothetical protein